MLNSFLVAFALVLTLASFGESCEAEEIVKDHDRAIGLEATGESVSDSLQSLVRSQAKAVNKAIRSGDLQGTLSFENLRKNGQIASIMFRIRFSESRHLTEVSPGKGAKNRFDKVKTVVDKSGHCEAVFSKRIRPFECEASVYPSGSGSHHIPHQILGPSRLTQVLSDVVWDKFEINMTKASDGRLIGKYDIGNETQLIFETSPKLQHNITKVTVSFDGGTTIATYDWKQVDGVWYVKRVDKRTWQADEFVARESTVFSKVTLNKKVEPILFSLNALDLSQGARILDKRSSTSVTAYSYQMAEIKPNSSISDQVEQLEVRSVHQH